MTLTDGLRKEIGALNLAPENKLHLEGLILRHIEEKEAEIHVGIDRALGLVPALVRIPVRKLLLR